MGDWKMADSDSLGVFAKANSLGRSEGQLCVHADYVTRLMIKL